MNKTRYNINPADVGRLEVGTETLVDKSKSTKTVLMDLFPDNTDMEGATVINACYGGTAALLNAFLWVESDGWDGRYAVVVAADIATYARGPARPTCGCGAAAVLIGRDAPLVFDPRHRATHASHTWDFYKPDHTVEYPVVDGALSQACYYRALEDCYTRFCRKVEQGGGGAAPAGSIFTAESPDYLVFHAPYNKLVQKSYGRLFLCDARRRYAAEQQQQQATADEKTLENGHHAAENGPHAAENGHRAAENGHHHDATTTSNGQGPSSSSSSFLLKKEWLTMPLEDTYEDRDLEAALKTMSAAAFQQRLSDANVASQLVGNTYTASVFLGLASLLDRVHESLTPGKSIVVFSYGSGALATMYRLEM